MSHRSRAFFSGLALIVLSTTSIAAETAPKDDASGLAKKAQNPIADMVSFPLQFNFNGDIGPFERTQFLLNVQPVLPVTISKQVSLITRWIVPVLGQPDAQSATDTTWGVGDINPQLFLALILGDWTLGLGPSFFLPTATDSRLGQGKLSVGPSFVFVYSKGALVAGGLVSYDASVAGDDQRPDVRLFSAQPFININLPLASYLVTAPIITREFESDSTTVPLGAGFGKIFRFGTTPTNISFQAYGNVVHPDGGPTWQTRLQMQFIFPQPPPKKKKAEAEKKQ